MLSAALAAGALQVMEVAEGYWRLRPAPALTAINATGIAAQLHLLSPAELGVAAWQVGDFARYHYQRIEPDGRRVDLADVVFELVGQLLPGHAVSARSGIVGSDHYWLKIRGFESFRGHLSDIFLLVSRQDLRQYAPRPGFRFEADYIPLDYNRLHSYPPPDPPPLETLGQELVETPVGWLPCARWHTELGSAKLQVWSHPTAGPLGLVWLRSETEILALAAFGHRQETQVPSTLQPLIDGKSTFAHFCDSCHEHDDPHSRIFPPR